MAQILGFIKTHLITLVSGLAIIGCVVFAMLGMGSDEVVKAMAAEKQRIGADRIRSLSGDPKNESIIAAAEAANAEFKQTYEATLERAREINARTPLMEGVFPEPATASTPVRFVEAYRRRLEQLPRKIQGGTLPTELEIAEEQQNVDDLIALEAEQEAETTVASGDGGRTPVAAPVRPTSSGGLLGGRGAMGGRGGLAPPGGLSGRGGLAPPGGLSGRGGLAPPGGGRFGGMQPGGGRFGGGGMQPAATPSAARPPSGEPKYDATYRARVNKALSIQCYVEPYLSEDLRISQTLHVSPIILETSAPLESDMWYAQLSLWLQEDVLEAIGALNDEAAGQAGDGDATVAEVPVKRVKQIEVEGYVLDPADLPIPSLRPSRQSGINEGSFTGRTGNELYDVIRYKLVVVIDQRDINLLVDALSRVNFSQCTGMQYFTVDRVSDEQGSGYFYGPDPVVELHLDFEAYFLRSAFKDLMPPSIQEALGIAKSS